MENTFARIAGYLDQEGAGPVTLLALRNETGIRVWTPDGPAAPTPVIDAAFAARAELSAVLFCSPHHCVRAAEAGLTIPPVLDDSAQILGPKLRRAADSAAVRRILRKNNACLLRSPSPGVLCVGRSLMQAAAAALIAEKSARVYEDARKLGGARPLSGFVAHLMHSGYNKKYSRLNDIPSVSRGEGSAEQQAVVDCGRQMLAENLVQGTWGNISLRLDDKTMLVTPSGRDYEKLSAAEVVAVDMDTLEYAGDIRPTSERAFHAALLKLDPGAGCVIHSHPNRSSAFAAALKAMPVVDEEDRALLGSRVPCTPPALPGSKKLCRQLAETMGRSGSACIMGNHGIVVRGKSIEDALDKCRAMERAAARYLETLE
ncbi:MAG: class II aldolase/adducin family protein [Ruminococcaceae bacterium]|nr:class II aldolase/adducin family protein [Oscillospiraceae bacterium]